MSMLFIFNRLTSFLRNLINILVNIHSREISGAHLHGKGSLHFQEETPFFACDDTVNALRILCGPLLWVSIGFTCIQDAKACGSECPLWTMQENFD